MDWDFGCFREDDELCWKCEARMESLYDFAVKTRQDEKDHYWSEEIMQKFRLTQDQQIKRIVERSKNPPPKIIPMTPFPNCNLCGDPGGITLPDTKTFCGGCWRIHCEVQESLKPIGEQE